MNHITSNIAVQCRHVRNKMVHAATIAAAAIMVIQLSAGAEAAELTAVSQRYGDYCSVCHGDRGQGARHAQQGMIPAPKNFADPAFVQSMTRERMIAWRTELSDDEIAELADYIIGNFMTPADVRAVDDDSAHDGQETITIYQESCSVCHGDDGTGAVWGQE